MGYFGQEDTFVIKYSKLVEGPPCWFRTCHSEDMFQSQVWPWRSPGDWDEQKIKRCIFLEGDDGNVSRVARLGCPWNQLGYVNTLL